MKMSTPTATDAMLRAFDKGGYHYIEYGGKNAKERAISEAKKRLKKGQGVSVLSLSSPGIRSRTYRVYYRGR